MSQSSLKAGLLGLNDAGQLLLKALSLFESIDICAVADKNPALAENFAKHYSCDSYDDYRQLITQNQLDCLLVAEGMHICSEYVRTAMKKKFHILKTLPPSRNFEELNTLVKLAEKQNVNFAIANPGRFSHSFIDLCRFFNNINFSDVFLITATCAADNAHLAPWQTDRKLAGGGVLLQECYPLIDQIVANTTTPLQVYSLNSNQASDRKQRNYLTEDTALMTMKFSETAFGHVTASRHSVFGPSGNSLKIHTRDQIAVATENSFRITDTQNRETCNKTYQDTTLQCMTQLLENFVLSITDPEQYELKTSARHNLRPMSVIESAYLSARTGMPEQPASIQQITSLEPTNLWPS